MDGDASQRWLEVEISMTADKDDLVDHEPFLRHLSAYIQRMCI